MEGLCERTHHYAVARVALGKPFQHIMLDSKNSKAIKQRGNASDSVNLEGDFSNYFSLYFSKNDHINALNVITSDVMQTLIDTNTS